MPGDIGVIEEEGGGGGGEGDKISFANDLCWSGESHVLTPHDDGLEIARSLQESYISLSDATKFLKMNVTILGKVISSA